MQPTELAQAIAAGYTPPAIGKPSKIGDAAVVATLLTSLQAGNRREASYKLAGVHRATVSDWRAKAEANEQPYVQLFEAFDALEAEAEHRMVRKVVEDKQWQSAAWYLERKHPDGWAKKESETGSHITIIVGMPGAHAITPPIDVIRLTAQELAPGRPADIEMVPRGTLGEPSSERPVAKMLTAKDLATTEPTRKATRKRRS